MTSLLAPPTVCPETYVPTSFGSGEQVEVTCVRTDPAHIERGLGQHQGYEDIPEVTSTFLGKETTRPAWRRLWVWDEGGAHGFAGQGSCFSCHESNSRSGIKDHYRDEHRVVTCIDCGTFYDSAYAPGRCGSCALWSQRASEFASGVDAKGGFFVRPDGSDRLYHWTPGSTGGFGNRAYIVTVRLGDGTKHTVGPSDSLWSSGIIPVWLREQFPANGAIADAHGALVERGPLG